MQQLWLRTFRCAACLVVLACQPALMAAQQPPGFSAAWREVEGWYRGRVEREGIVGSSLWFVHDGRVLARAFHGFADLDSGRRVDEHTIFHWASITKTLTGIAVMQLRDRGLLSLDDPAVRYLPELREVHNPFGSVEDVTIRHLLSHSAGFRGPTWPWGGDKAWHPHEPTRWEQLVAMMPYTEVLFEPGSRYSYSNPGIVFLGRIIELLTGDDFEVYMDKNVLKPLGMYRSYYDITPYHLLRYRSNNYYASDGDLVANGLDFDTGITTSNGGLNAPIPDMVEYLRFLGGDPDKLAGDGAILSRASLEEMWEVQQPVPSEEGDDSLRQFMGLTYFILERGDLRVIGHTGGQKGFISFFYLDPVSGAAAIAAFNTLGLSAEGSPKPDTRRVLSELRAMLFDRIFPLFREGTDQ